MSYVKTGWVNGPNTATPITADRLNNLETQHDAALAQVAADIPNGSSPIGAVLSTTIDGKVVAESSPFSALISGLQMGYEDLGVGLLGDSTGNAVDEWFYMTALALAPEYPAYTVHHRMWNDTTQAYDRPTVIQTGAAGARYVQLASSGTIAAVGYAGANVAGDIDLRIYVTPLSWRTGTQTLISKFGSAGNRTLRFQINSSGYPTLGWTADGTTEIMANPLTAVPFADGQPGWVRVTLDVDNGAGGNVTTFYSSTDGTTWTQLGGAQTKAGVTSLFASTFKWELGARTSTAEPLTGAKIHEVEIRDGISGPTIAPRLPSAWGRGVGTGVPTIVGAPVLTFVNGSLSGAGIAYLGETTRVKKLTPDFSQAVQLFSDSHNEQYSVGSDWIALLSGWVASVGSRLPLSAPILFTQNPRIPPADFIEPHGIRRRQTMSWAKAQGHGVVDTYGAFLSSGIPLSTLTESDGIHPSHTVGGGSTVWRDAVVRLLV